MVMGAMFGSFWFWGLLTLALILMALGMFQFARPHYDRYGRPTVRLFAGFTTLVIGFLLGAFSLFAWNPQMASFDALQSKWASLAGREGKLAQENSRLGDLLKSHDGEFRTLKAQNESLASRLSSTDQTIEKLLDDVKKQTTKNIRLEQRLKGLQDKESEVTRLNAVVDRLNEDHSAMKAENARLKGLLSTSRTNKDEVDRLNTVIARLNKEQATITLENTRLKGVLSTNRTDSGEIERLNGIIKRLNQEKVNVDTENGRIKGLLSTYRNDSEVQNAKIASLEAVLAKLRNKPPVSRSLAPKRCNKPLAMIHKYNQDETKLKLTSSDYNIVKAANIEMIDGHKGEYYIITLKNPADGKGYKFASASYSRVEKEGQFKQSLDRVISDIRGAFEGRRDFQLYVRGKASAGRYSGKLTPGYEYTNIKLLERVRGGGYGKKTVTRQYGPTISNDDLPNLRGAYLQEFVGKNYKVAKPIILDGKVSKSMNANNQAVALILFVKD
jgi:predicted  nucleic acid-binding Zn-ribbon protein